MKTNEKCPNPECSEFLEENCYAMDMDINGKYQEPNCIKTCPNGCEIEKFENIKDVEVREIKSNEEFNNLTNPENYL